jgi:hypothetical protein
VVAPQYLHIISETLPRRDPKVRLSAREEFLAYEEEEEGGRRRGGRRRRRRGEV